MLGEKNLQIYLSNTFENGISKIFERQIDISQPYEDLLPKCPRRGLCYAKVRSLELNLDEPVKWQGFNKHLDQHLLPLRVCIHEKMVEKQS